MQYKYLKIVEAKLVKRGKSWYLHITFKKAKREGLTVDEKKEEFKPTGVIADNINQDFIMVGNDKQTIEIPTRLDDAYHYMQEAQKLQRKYPYKWRYSKHILNRIAHLFRKGRNILVDFAKKAGKWIVEVTLLLKANVIVLEKLTKMIYRVGDLRKTTG